MKDVKSSPPPSTHLNGGHSQTPLGPKGLPWGTYPWFKRMLDVVLAGTGMVLALPLLIVCGLWIRHCDRGPALYRQWRVGHNGWLFPIYKLRTMVQDAEHLSGARFAHRGDPRILPGCGWMRKSHVDELPQLWNILVGHMSLVGPRPERPEIIDLLRQKLPGIERRFAATPGLTGLAQVRNGYANDLRGSRRKLAYDLLYLRTQSLRHDLSLLFRTIPRIWDRAAL